MFKEINIYLLAPFLVGFARLGICLLRLVKEGLLSRDVLAAPLMATVDVLVLMIINTKNSNYSLSIVLTATD